MGHFPRRPTSCAVGKTVCQATRDRSMSSAMAAGGMCVLRPAPIAHGQTERIVATARKASTRPSTALAGVWLKEVRSATGTDHSSVNAEARPRGRLIAPHTCAALCIATFASEGPVLGHVRAQGSAALARSNNELPPIAGRAVLIATADPFDLGNQAPTAVAEPPPSMVSAHS